MLYLVKPTSGRMMFDGVDILDRFKNGTPEEALGIRRQLQYLGWICSLCGCIR